MRYNTNDIYLKVYHLIVDKDLTLRETAKQIGCSKSLIGNMVRRKTFIYCIIANDLSIDKLYDTLNMHFETKHIKGGESTKHRWMCRNVIKEIMKNR